MADKHTKRSGQVSLASTTAVSRELQKKKKKKKKVSAGTKIVRALVIILVILSLAFIGVLVYGVVSSLSTGGSKHQLTATTYDTTPEAQEKKVGYYLFGVNGATADDEMSMLTLLCYDKKAKTAQLLQLPTDTYIGNSGAFKVSRIGNVWNNPTPLTWCETCRKQVYEPEQENGKHTVCQTALTEKTGSSVESLLAVLNDQYSMPVDNYFIFPQETLVNLVDLVGGIDVTLETAIQVDGTTYAAGKRVLGGKAALYYAHTYDYNKTPAKDLTRLLRQRKVWTALLQRMTAMDDDKLYENVISTIMAGGSPIRTNSTAGAIAKMLAGIHTGNTENITYAKALSEWIYSFRKVDFEKSVFYILPGQVAKLGTATYYGVNRAETLKLLQEHFNPYGIEMKEEHLQITEIGKAGKTDLQPQSIAELMVEQSTPTTTAPTTAATTAS